MRELLNSNVEKEMMESESLGNARDGEMRREVEREREREVEEGRALAVELSHSLSALLDALQAREEAREKELAQFIPMCVALFTEPVSGATGPGAS